MRLSIALASLFLGLSAPVSAQSAPITPGMQVVDTSGGAVGLVTQVSGDFVVVKTDRHEVRLPTSSFTANKGKLLFGMTRAELNAATDRSLAEAAAAIAPGATVTGSGGAVLGTIDAVDAEFLTLKLESGALVRLPRSAVAAGPNGVVVGLTAAELEAQVTGASAQ